MDPVLLFAGEDAITEGVKDCIAKAGHQVEKKAIMPNLCSCAFSTGLLGRVIVLLIDYPQFHMVFSFMCFSGTHPKPWTWCDGWNARGKCCPHVCPIERDLLQWFPLRPV